MSKNDLSQYGLGTDVDDDELLDDDFGNEHIGTDDDDDGVPVPEPDDEPQPEPEPEPEPEPTPEPDDEPTPEPEPEPEPEPKSKNSMVPRERLNKEIAKRRQVEQELEQYRKAPPKAEAPKAPPVDKEQLKTALEQVLDGKTDDAAEALAVLFGAKEAAEMQRTLAPEDVSTYVEQALQQREINACVTRVVKDNSWMDDSNEDTFDSDATEEVLVWRDILIRRGHTTVEAIEAAVERVGKEYGYIQDAPAPAPAAKSKAAVKPADLAKKVELAKKAPAAIPRSTAPVGRDRVTVEDMSEDEFNNLSGEALARARGDII